MASGTSKNFKEKETEEDQRYI